MEQMMDGHCEADDVLVKWQARWIALLLKLITMSKELASMCSTKQGELQSGRSGWRRFPGGAMCV
jgi:hypothetical protein